MTELLLAIATLCQVSSSAKPYHESFSLKETYEFQLKCQREYFSCVERKSKKAVKRIKATAASASELGEALALCLKETEIAK